MECCRFATGRADPVEKPPCCVATYVVAYVVEFEWDSAKAKLNLRKHGVSFEDAARVFLDPDRIEAFDSDED
jgi:hypothetical protein